MKRYWTSERVIESLKQAMKVIKGKLPCNDRCYNKLKKGRMDWPPVRRIFEYFHSLARAWLAAGASKKRVSVSYTKWTWKEDEYLLSHAGDKKLEDIADYLGRSYPSTRYRLNRYYKTKARENLGHISASQLSKLYKCPYHRVRNALASGVIKGEFDQVRNSWRVLLIDITPEAEKILKAPKEKSYKTYPPDLGDYYQRYNIRRPLINGKVTPVECY